MFREISVLLSVCEGTDHTAGVDLSARAAAEADLRDCLLVVERQGPASVDALMKLLGRPDLDTVFAAAFTLSSLPSERQTLNSVLEAFASQQRPERRTAFVRAFCLVGGTNLLTALKRIAQSGSPDARADAIEVLGYRRAVDPDALLPLLEHSNERLRRAAFRAIARLGRRSDRLALERSVLSAPAGASDDELRGLLRLGSAYALDLCRASASREHARPEHLVTLALAGNATDLDLLASHIARPRLRLACIEAIGLHGHPRALPLLLDGLDQPVPELRESAATALRRLAGPLFGAEKRPWLDWWENQGERLKSTIRLRSGRPFSLLCLIQSLESGAYRSVERERALLELETRTGRRYPLELDDTAAAQRAGISAWRTWWQSEGCRLQNGVWSFQSNPVPHG